MEHPVEAVANNLKELRDKRNLSLDQLAELTGVSKSMLRQIETGQSNPTIGTIWKIANGLRISFTSLLTRAEVKAEVKSFTGGPSLTAESQHYRLFPMISFNPRQPFETYYFEIDPGTVFKGEPHEGEVYEYLFVIGGRLEILVDGKAYQVGEQEFLEFLADRPHEYRCISRKTAAAIMQVSYLG